MEISLYWWIGFNVFVLIMLALDLGVFHRHAHEVKVKEALIWSLVWISLALIFNAFVYLWFGRDRGLEFLTGYLVEKSLSIDNIFVFVIIFSYFNVPAKYQHRVLFWGIIGALVMRAIFIFAGVALMERFHWIIYVFGAFLLFTGIRLSIKHDNQVNVEGNPLIRLLKKLVPVTSDYHESRFFVKINGIQHATPLFLVLLLVETTDLIFAVDSIPAILAITQDTFIVYTSNVFAILGLRSLYFALSGVLQYFRYLHYGLAAILVFVGIKMIISDFYKFNPAVSLLIILGILLVSMLASLLTQKK